MPPDESFEVSPFVLVSFRGPVLRDKVRGIFF